MKATKYLVSFIIFLSLLIAAPLIGTNSQPVQPKEDVAIRVYVSPGGYYYRGYRPYYRSYYRYYRPYYYNAPYYQYYRPYGPYRWGGGYGW